MTYRHRGADGDAYIMQQLKLKLGLGEVIDKHQLQPDCEAGNVGRIVTTKLLATCPPESPARDELNQLFSEYAGIVHVLGLKDIHQEVSYHIGHGQFEEFNQIAGFYEDRLNAFLDALVQIAQAHALDIPAIVDAGLTPAARIIGGVRVPTGTHEKAPELLQAAKERLCKGLGIAVPEDKNVYEIWNQYASVMQVAFAQLNDSIGSHAYHLRNAMTHGYGLATELNKNPKTTQDKLDTIERWGKALCDNIGESMTTLFHARIQLCKQFDIEVGEKPNNSHMSRALAAYIGKGNIADVISATEHLLGDFRQSPAHYGHASELLGDGKGKCNSRMVSAMAKAIQMVHAHPELKPLWEGIRERAQKAERRRMRVEPPKPDSDKQVTTLFEGEDWTLQMSLRKATAKGRGVLDIELRDENPQFRTVAIIRGDMDKLKLFAESVPERVRTGIREVQAQHAPQSVLSIACSQLERQLAMEFQRMNTGQRRG